MTEALISHKAIRKVEFIGSAAVGMIIGSLAGKYLNRCLWNWAESVLLLCLKTLTWMMPRLNASLQVGDKPSFSSASRNGLLTRF